MDFDFSDDQQQLRDAVRKWVDKGYTFERRNAIVASGGFDRAAYGELAELGLAMLLDRLHQWLVARQGFHGARHRDRARGRRPVRRGPSVSVGLADLYRRALGL